MTNLTEAASASESKLLEVVFVDLNTNDTARFAVPRHVTLLEAWNMAYDELEEVRRPNDELQSHGGQPLAADLDKTIKQVQEHVVPDLKFQIRGEQGGA